MASLSPFMTEKRPPAIFLMGPTASGKTELAMRLVELLPCEIISVDSAQVYRGMDIGTAKPDRETLRRIPHRLIDICDPSEPYSAARFREDALREMTKISSAGKIPLLVGGTMLYFRALQQGVSLLPAADPEVRRRLDAEADRWGWAAMHARLREVDPEAASRIHPNDPQRIQRALEVYELTGRSLSDHFRLQQREELPFRLMKVGLLPRQRAVLHERIERRFHAMLEQGLVGEVRGLFERGDLSPELPAMRAVGYRQVWQYLSGEYDYHTMVHRAITATRQLAKRQMTWLRAEEDVCRIEFPDAEIFSVLLKLLAGKGLPVN